MKITTVEGVGGKKAGYNTIQQRIVDHNGSQVTKNLSNSNLLEALLINYNLVWFLHTWHGNEYVQSSAK